MSILRRVSGFDDRRLMLAELLKGMGEGDFSASYGRPDLRR
jgi:hypothetical protein